MSFVYNNIIYLVVVVVVSVDYVEKAKLLVDNYVDNCEKLSTVSTGLKFYNFFHNLSTGTFPLIHKKMWIKLNYNIFLKLFHDMFKLRISINLF